MADAKRCDACRNYYEIYDNKLTITVASEGPKSRKDLCPECHEKVYNIVFPQTIETIGPLTKSPLCDDYDFPKPGEKLDINPLTKKPYKCSKNVREKMSRIKTEEWAKRKGDDKDDKEEDDKPLKPAPDDEPWKDMEEK